MESKRSTGQHTNDSAIKINETLKFLGRFLIPISYSKVGRFDHDLAVPIPPVPILAEIANLRKLKTDSDELRYLLARLKKESNKVGFALLQSEKLVSRVLKEVEQSDWRVNSKMSVVYSAAAETTMGRELAPCELPNEDFDSSSSTKIVQKSPCADSRAFLIELRLLDG